MVRWVADMAEIAELKAEVARLLKVVEAAAYVDLRWGADWDVSAIWDLRAALASLPNEKQIILKDFANWKLVAEREARAKRVAEFDAWMAENRPKVTEV